MNRSLRLWRTAAAMSMLCGIAPTALAQDRAGVSPSASVASQHAATSNKWELDLHLGGGRAGTLTKGTGVVPPPSVVVLYPLALPAGTRNVPSWFFGSGAALANEINTSGLLGSTPLKSIDSVLTTTTSADVGNGLVAGARLSRRLGSRLGIEFAVDVGTTGVGFTTDALKRIEASRASFTNYWSGVAALLNFEDVRVEASIDDRPGIQLEIQASTALRFDLHRSARRRYYVSAGGGLVASTGQDPSVTLAGQYTFRFLRPEPYHETDTVVLHARSPRRRLIGLLGGGWTSSLTNRTGIQIDGRLALGRRRVDVTVDATPTRVLVTDPSFARAGILAITGEEAPSLGAHSLVIIFNNNAELDGAFPASLSGAPIAGFTAYKSRGVQANVAITAGLYVKF